MTRSEITEAARWLVLRIAIVIGWLSFATHVWAGGPPLEALRKAADQLYDEGVAAYKRGDLKKARDNFKASHKLAHTPRAAANLGQTEYDLANYRAAADAFEEALLEMRYLSHLDDLDGESNPETKQARQEKIARLEPRLEKARAHIVTATIECRAPTPLGAARGRITFSGMHESACGDVVHLDPGPYAVDVRVPSHAPLRRNVFYRKGERPTLIFDLELLPPPTPIAPPPPSPEKLPWWPVIPTTALGLGGIAAGIPLALEDDTSDLGIGLGIAGGALLTAGLVYLIVVTWDAPKRPTAGAWGPGGAPWAVSF